jgi:hypothetical protein
MSYLIAAYAITVGTLAVYAIALSRESTRLRLAQGQRNKGQQADFDRENQDPEGKIDCS